MKQIPIFFTFNNDYVIPAAVAFHSLLEKVNTDTFYEMFVAHSDITLENQALLSKIVDSQSKGLLKFIDTKDFLHNEWNNGNFEEHNKGVQFTVDTIVRCFAASFFPNIDKIIYSDVDVVFMDDISELIDIDLTDKYIASVKNAFLKYSPKELSHLSDMHYEKLKDTYFAGGIWVMNLSEIRKNNLETRMIEIIKDKNIIKRWNDQDIMNIACDNKVSYLSLRYISYPYLEDVMKEMGFESHFSQEELFESIEKPKILHFAGVKPWNAFPRKGEVWLNIFKSLNLPKTRIFKDMSLKYKILFYIWSILDKKLKKKRIIQ